MNVAVILAGGSGNRFGGDRPKQFLKVAGKMIIEHTIDIFENNDKIDEIAIVCKEEFIPDVEQMVIDNQFRKVGKILHGGRERYHSSLSAINAYPDDVNLIFHDAVRPLLNNRIINDCIEALAVYNAVDVAIPATDTIIRVESSSNTIDSIPDRNQLMNGQTPQCFKRQIIKKAYDLALKDPGFKTTDDCGVVKKYLPDEPVFVVKGEPFNMKVTHVEDLFLLDKLFQLKSSSVESKLIVEQARSLLKGKVIVVFGGSSGIGKEVVRLGEACGAKTWSFSRRNQVDISSIQQVESALQTVVSSCGRIDFVVCSAAVLIKKALNSLSDTEIVNSVNTNYLGAVNVAKASFDYLKQTRGALLFYTSSSYTRGRMLYSIYSSTKAAVVNLTQALSEEWFRFGVRVNCINPERTRTPMRLSNFGIEPEGTLLDPERVAMATLNTLASDLTGEVIDVRR